MLQPFRLTQPLFILLLALPFLLLLQGRTTTAQDYCNGLQPGHVMVSGFNMMDPDEVVLVILEDVPANSALYMTDRPWDGSAFLDDVSTDDGTLKWSFGTSFFAGTEICFRCTQDGSVVDQFQAVKEGTNGTFSLDSPDTIHVYCEMEPDSDGVSEIVHISAITNAGWASTTDNANVTLADSTTSVLPTSLAETMYTTLSAEYPNYEYDGNTVGTAAQIRVELSDATFWEGHLDYIENLQTQSSFKIIDEPSGGTAARHVFSFVASFLVVLVL